MRYPKFLQPGGNIGFIAPSFGASSEPYITQFRSACNYFENAGFKLTFGPNVFEGSGIGKSNTPKACGDEINDFFLNDRSDIILSMGGGETMCEDLPFVDFEGIAKAEPKWYMGYSDNTNLTFTLATLCDTASVYGPCAPSFGMKPRHKALSDALGILMGNCRSVSNYDKWERVSLKTSLNPLQPYNTTENFMLRRFVGANEAADANAEIKFTGRLLGGCLDCLSNLVGTSFDRVSDFNDKYADDGIIWFLESCELNVMSIRRALWQMEQAGWFKNAKAFLIGRPYEYEDSWGDFDRIAAVVGILGKYNVPIILDLDIGHLPPMMPIICGACADVTVWENSFDMKYRFR